MSESYGERTPETTGSDAAMASMRSEAAPPLDDRIGTVEPVSQLAPGADRPVDSSVQAITRSDQVSVEEQDRRERPTRADGVEYSSVTAVGGPDAMNGALVSNGDSFRTRWSSVQVGFVDDPGRAVEEAEQLVTDVIADLVDGFRQHRQRLDGGGNGSTDEMRAAFRRYRDFFDRLLNV